jgi:hypothetical protein
MLSEEAPPLEFYLMAKARATIDNACTLIWWEIMMQLQQESKGNA